MEESSRGEVAWLVQAIGSRGKEEGAVGIWSVAMPLVAVPHALAQPLCFRTWLLRCTLTKCCMGWKSGGGERREKSYRE